jgi:RNA-directed DNA polymerase
MRRGSPVVPSQANPTKRDVSPKADREGSTNLSLEDLLRQLNRMLRGWTAYFKYGCSNATFSYLRAYLWKEIVRWQERKHRRVPWKVLRRRYGIWPAEGGMELFDPARVSAKRYYYPGNTYPDSLAEHSMK